MFCPQHVRAKPDDGFPLPHPGTEGFEKCMNQKDGVMARKPRRSTQVATAYHEAGHAVAAWRLGIALRRNGVTIVPDKERESSGSTSLVQTVRRADIDSSGRNSIRAERAVQVMLAGQIAQRRYNPRSIRHYHAESDRKSAIDLLFYFTADTKELEAWLKLLHIRTENMLSNPDVWNAVKRLAAALVQMRTIRRKEAIEIIREGFKERLYARYPQARRV
jgi:hypothetical protein